jgi:hypothetical protein
MKTTHFRRILIAAVFLSCTLGYASANGVCSRDEAIVAETEAATLNHWEAVYRSYKRFRHCDDGAIAEAYSDVVTRLLDREWDQFSRLQFLVEQDRHFEGFILRHIDETATRGTLEAITKNAREHCPVTAGPLCASIISTIERVLKAASSRGRQ